MNKAKSFISKLLYNKFFWQLIFSAFLIGTSVFFIRHENVELFRITEQLKLSNAWYVLMGILLTGVYIVFQDKCIFTVTWPWASISLLKWLCACS